MYKIPLEYEGNYARISHLESRHAGNRTSSYYPSAETDLSDQL
jgi:hypothetical protein